MRWFDRPYVSGELDEDEWAARSIRYAKHLDSIQDHLDRGAELLVGLSLHDGQVAEWDYVSGDRFTMRFLAGDLQVGYVWLTLGYRSAFLIGATTEDLGRWFVNDATEIIEQDISIGDDQTFEHHLLLDPAGEFGVRFRSLEISSVSAPASARR